MAQPQRRRNRTVRVHVAVQQDGRPQRGGQRAVAAEATVRGVVAVPDTARRGVREQDVDAPASKQASSPSSTSSETASTRIPPPGRRAARPAAPRIQRTAASRTSSPCSRRAASTR